MHYRFSAQLLGPIMLCLTGIGPANAAGVPVEQPANSHARSQSVGGSAQQNATALVARMTLDEKLGQLVNSAPAIPRLGIPAYEWWSEALHGSVSDLDSTDFPEPIGLAATFDDKLIHNVASAISEEVRAIHGITRAAGRVGVMDLGDGLDVWAPNINIFRDPRWGRGQETYGEDPFLTARMGVAFVTGMQGPNPDAPNVIATPKHFAVHSGPESTRHTADVTVSLHDLEDTYLPAFRAAIVEGHAGSIMCAYNSINGQPACANDFLLKTKLRGDWGFKGYVVSDCDALNDIVRGHKYAPDQETSVADAIKAGMDNECAAFPSPGGPAKRYADAISKGLITEADIDKALIRLFTARLRIGDLRPNGHAGVPEKAQPVITEAHKVLALETAEKSLVLLKNSGVLPLRGRNLKIVVAGPLADGIRVLRGNYSSADIPAPVSVLAGLKAQFPNAEIRYVPAGPSYTDGDTVPSSALFTTDGKPGVTAETFALKPSDPARPEAAFLSPDGLSFEATPFRSVVVEKIGQDLDPSRSFYKTVYSGVLVPSETGTYRLGIKGMNAELTFDGKAFASLKGFPVAPLGDLKTVHLEKGHRYPFQFAIVKTGFFGAQLVWTPVSDDPAAALAKAAQDADVIVAVVGLTSDLEGEEAAVNIPGFSGGDRTTLDLPADQQQLLEAAKATGKKLVAVTMNGSALNLSWAKTNADAILEAWYPGEDGGTAIARVLAGAVNPAGRLPVTFYADVASLPPFADYSMQGRTYRYYTGAPVYPFGYGLSYTTFGYGPLSVQRDAAPGSAFSVRTTVTNTGNLAGDEVAQLYLKFPDSPGVPRIALRSFQRVHLAPGAQKSLEFRLTPRDLSSVSPEGERRVLAGSYRLIVGGGQPDTGASTTSASLTVERSEPVAK